MSAKSDRKKRLGSRRMANNHEVDKMSMDQQQIPEESGQSLTVSSADSSKCEIQHPPALEVSMNRRKLGSSRKSKGRQFVKGPETELPYEAQEKVEQETKNFKSSETQMSGAVQLEEQGELNWGSEHNTSATPDPTTTFYPEDVMESLTRKVDQTEASSNDTKLEETKISDSLESREIKENTREFSRESESPIKDNTDLFGQDGSLQGNYWVDESYVKSVVLETATTEKAANKSSLQEKNEIEMCVEQATVFLPKEEFPTNEYNDLSKLSEVTDAEHSEHVVHKGHEKNDETISVQGQGDVSSQSVINDKEHPKICSQNQEPEIISSDQSEAVVESTYSAVEKEVATIDEKQTKGPTIEGDLEVLEQKNEDGYVYDSKKTGITNIERKVGWMCEDAGLVENEAKYSHEESVHQVVEEVVSEVKRSNFSPQTQKSDLDTPLGPQPQDSPVSMDEQTNAGFSLSGNRRRKLGSSRKVKRTEEEILEKSREDEALEITKLPLATETTCQEELNQDHEHDILSMSHESPLFPISAAGFSEVQVSMPTKYPEADLEIVIFEGENSPEDQDERETENNLQVADKSVEVSLQDDDKSESRQSKEVESAHVLEDAVREQQEDEVHSTQMLNNLQTDYTCETEEVKENYHVTFRNQIDQEEIINTDLPDFIISNTDDSAAKQEVSIMANQTDEYPTKENISEPSGLRNADYDFYDTNKPYLGDKGNADSCPSQVHDFMCRVEDDLKSDADQIFHPEKEGLLTEMEETNSALLTFHSKSAVSLLAQPQEKSLSFDEEHSKDFPHSGNRMELGSSHENKEKHKVKDIVKEECYEEADNNEVSYELSETTTETTCQEKSREIMDGRQKKGILQTEEANTHTGTLVTTSELTIIGGHSASMIDHEVTDKSCYREMPDEEPPDVSLTTGTEKREIDERPELLIQVENYQQNHLVCEQHACPIIPVMLTEKSSSNKHTEPAWSDEKASPVDELATKEGQLYNVRVTRHSGNDIRKAHEQEIEPARMQDISETDNATENTEILSRNLYDQVESGDIHHLNVTVRNVNDAQPQIGDTEQADAAVGDAHEMKDQGKYDLSLSAEDTAHQVREGHFSEMGDIETNLQSLQNETQALLDSRPQQNETSFNPISNRGTLGSPQEKSMEVKVEEIDKTVSLFIENTAVHCKQNAQLVSVAGITEFNMSSSHSSPTAELQFNKSCSGELPEDRIPTVSTVIENKEKDEDMEMLKSYGNSQGHEPSSGNKENMTERATERCNPEYHTEFASSTEQRFSSPQEKILETAEQVELFNSSEAAKAEDSENVGSEAHEEQIVPQQNQEMHQTDHTSVTVNNCPLQILQSHTDVSLDSKPLDTLLSTKDETQSTFKTAGNRRKMGSSRRKKGTQQHVEGPESSQEPKEEVLKMEHDEATGELATRTSHRELRDISIEKVEKIIPTGTEDETTVKLQDVNTFNPHYVVDNSTFATSNINLEKEDSLKSIPDDNEKDTKFLKEPEKLSQLTGYDTDKKGMMQFSQASDQKVDSDTQNISYHDDIISTTHQVPDQDKVFQCQSIGILSLNEELRGHELRLPPSDNLIGTVGSFTTEDHSVEVEGSIDGKGFEQDDVGEKHEVNISQEPAVDESTTLDARTTGEEKTQSDYSENVQENTKMKKRKLGSTRRTLPKGKQEGETDNKDNTKGENVQTLQDTVERRDTDEAGPILHEESELQNITSDRSRRFNAIPVLLEESSSEIEAVVNLATSDEVADKQSDKINVDHCVETFTRTEMEKATLVTEENSGSMSQLVPSNTETSTTIAPESSASFCESSRNDEDGAVSVKVSEVQATNQQRSGKINEGGHNEDLEMKSASPDLNLNHRRKKMASTRRSLGSRAKGENLHQKQDLDNEATETSTAGEDATNVSSSGFEKQLQLQTEHTDVYARQQNEKEAVEVVHVDESKESPVSHQLTPSYYPAPSTSPKSDVLSESASGGRKKKFGSSRKSRIQQASTKEQSQNNRLIDSQNERHVSGITEEGAYRVPEEQRGESSRLDKLSEVDESNDNTSPNISISKPLGEKTPFQSQHSEISLVQDRQQQFSFADKPRGAELGSNSYNVVMLGDSSVGKTSFMKRAQSGKFSLDIPASVGLDSCIWTVVVDGKPVQLQLWDTAGQERFRSITRQILHKGQAFLLMYDITSPESFSSVSFWADHVQENAAEHVTVLLLGNKSDHAPRQVTTQEGENLAKEYNFEFMECSAATGENVIKALETVARMLSQKADSREEATLLLKKPAQEKRSRCC